MKAERRKIPDAGAWVNNAVERLAAQLQMTPEAFRLRALAMAVQIVDDNLVMDMDPFTIAAPETEFYATQELIGVPIAEVLKMEKGNGSQFAQRILYEMNQTDLGRPGRCESAWDIEDPTEMRRLRRNERKRAAWLTDDQWLLTPIH